MTLEYPLLLTGFEDQAIVVRSNDPFGVRKILQNGTPAPRDGKLGQYLLIDNQGRKIHAEFKAWQFGPIPTVLIDGTPVPPSRQIGVIEWLVAGLPHAATNYLTMVILFSVGLLTGETVREYMVTAVGMAVVVIGSEYGIGGLQSGLSRPIKYTGMFILLSVLPLVYILFRVPSQMHYHS